MPPHEEADHAPAIRQPLHLLLGEPGLNGAPVVRRHVLVSGRVQGVWFRQSAAEHARDQGVQGWVRNRADGRVELEVEGALPAVEAVVAWCHDGPRRARVEAVVVTEVEPTGERGFRVS